MANFTFWPYYLRGKICLYSLNNRQNARGAGQNAAAERKIIAFAGNQSLFIRLFGAVRLEFPVGGEVSLNAFMFGYEC